jgi:hypothetical protein
MTIKDLKNGTPFHYKTSLITYKLKRGIDYNTYSIATNESHVANIKSIGSKVIKGYTYVMQKRVNISIDIRDCKEATE